MPKKSVAAVWIAAVAKVSQVWQVFGSLPNFSCHTNKTKQGYAPFTHGLLITIEISNNTHNT
jgi:hypothetical protein